jgi:hypothetical protein
MDPFQFFSVPVTHPQRTNALRGIRHATFSFEQV